MSGKNLAKHLWQDGNRNWREDGQLLLWHGTCFWVTRRVFSLTHAFATRKTPIVNLLAQCSRRCRFWQFEKKVSLVLGGVGRRLHDPLLEVTRVFPSEPGLKSS
jgi:hypothetical protein